MHACIVCGNRSVYTMTIRPRIHYHRIPKNEHMRKKWLQVFGIDSCDDWQRICSDHFLDENYRPGNNHLLSNTIPQPLNRNSNRNGFHPNYATQSNDVKTGNNEILPTEQNIMRSLRRHSSSHTKNNEDIIIENKLDNTLRSRLRCSVKNCFNRQSKNLRIFGYPKDLALRKIWIEKCGLKKDSAKELSKGVRVCITHFKDECFRNKFVKKKLKPGAIPSLFLDDDIIDRRNIPSSSSLFNRCFNRTNNSSCSSSNDVANVESNKTPSLVNMDSTTRNTKDFEAKCSIPGCITNTKKEVEDISLFTTKIECVNEWSEMLGVQLTVNSLVCKRHFRPQDIPKPELLVNGFNEKLKPLAPKSLIIPIKVLNTSQEQFILPKYIKVGTKNLLDNTVNTSMAKEPSQTFFEVIEIKT